jgi:hypothetical protein
VDEIFVRTLADAREPSGLRIYVDEQLLSHLPLELRKLTMSKDSGSPKS